MSWWISYVRNSLLRGVNVSGSSEPSLVDWLWDRVTRTDRRCLLQRLAFSKSHHFSWDMSPANIMAYDNCTSAYDFFHLIISLHAWFVLCVFVDAFVIMLFGANLCTIASFEVSLGDTSMHSFFESVQLISSSLFSFCQQGVLWAE